MRNPDEDVVIGEFRYDASRRCCVCAHCGCSVISLKDLSADEDTAISAASQLHGPNCVYKGALTVDGVPQSTRNAGRRSLDFAIAQERERGKLRTETTDTTFDRITRRLIRSNPKVQA